MTEVLWEASCYFWHLAGLLLTGLTAGFDWTQCERPATLRGFNNHGNKKKTKRGSKPGTINENRNVEKEVWRDFTTNCSVKTSLRVIDRRAKKADTDEAFYCLATRSLFKNGCEILTVYMKHWIHLTWCTSEENYQRSCVSYQAVDGKATGGWCQW